MRQKIDRKRTFKLIALGWDTKRIMDETGISRRTYFRVRNEFLRLSEEERKRIFEEAKMEFEERIFDKKVWFDFKTCKSQIPIIQHWFDVMRVRQKTWHSFSPIHPHNSRKPSQPLFKMPSRIVPLISMKLVNQPIKDHHPYFSFHSASFIQNIEGRGRENKTDNQSIFPLAMG